VLSARRSSSRFTSGDGDPLDLPPVYRVDMTPFRSTRIRYKARWTRTANDKIESWRCIFVDQMFYCCLQDSHSIKIPRADPVVVKAISPSSSLDVASFDG
jgi:hypothetical protein